MGFSFDMAYYKDAGERQLQASCSSRRDVDPASTCSKIAASFRMALADPSLRVVEEEVA